MNRQELSAFMKDRNWDAAELAERVPCTAAYIRLLLQGKRTMGRAMEARIRSLPKRAKPVA